MNKEEALIYLPIDGAEELEEAYEAKIFEFKQFFLTQFPISKAFSGRLKKLRTVHQAYLTLGGSTEPFSVSTSPFRGTKKSVRATITEFQRIRNELKMRIHSSRDAMELEANVEQLLQLTWNYASLWPPIALMEKTEILIGKEPDPMEVLSALDDFEKKGNASFEDLSKFQEENMLKREAKRLSLWLNLEQHDK